jgi:hypothetical protein
MTPQNFIEFWSVAPRPRAVNGLGFTPDQAEAAVQELEQLFPSRPILQPFIPNGAAW